MDGLALAVGAGVDTIVDIATLTGAALMALGKSRAPVPGNNKSVVDQVVAAARRRSVAASAGAQYRKQLDSDVADISNSAARTPGHHGRTVPRRARGRHPLGSHRHRRHHVHRCGRRLALRRRHRFGARLASPSTSPPGRTWGRFLIRSNVPPERTWGRFLVRSRVKASAFKIDLCTLVGPNQEPSPGSVLGGADGLATARVNRFSAMSPLAAGGWLGF